MEHRLCSRPTSEIGQLGQLGQVVWAGSLASRAVW